MSDSLFQTGKLWLVDWSGLAKDALHVHIALALFLAWLVAPLLRTAPLAVRQSIAGLVLAFAVGCLFNSLLRDFIEGHFFVVVLSWLLAQAREQ